MSKPKIDVTPQQVEAKCKLFERTNTAISFKAIARTLGVHHELVARRTDLREVVERYLSKPAQQSKIRRAEYNEAIAQNGPPLKTYVDPNYVGLWNPRLGKEIEERERLRRKYGNRERFTQPGY